MGNRVFIHSNISDLELVDFYKNSDVFVLPSINESETFGIVQIEAMKYGLPIINTLLKSGVPEVSIDNLTGFTVEPSSAPKLLDAIIRISNDPKLYVEFSKNALERSKFYSNDKIKSEYVKILLGVIQGNKI
jgi:rhamnosyl/mannosyltransferase